MLVGFNAQQVIIQSEHIGFSLIVDYTGMVAASALSVVHNVALVFPRPCGAVTHRIAYTLGAACRRKRKIVVSVSLIEPGTLLIIFDMRQFHDVARIGNHILVQLHIVEVGVAPIHVSLSVVIDEYGRIYIVPMLFLPHERLAYGVLERAVRRIGYEHAYAVTVNRAIHVELAVTLYNLFSPGSVILVNPLEILQ